MMSTVQPWPADARVAGLEAARRRVLLVEDEPGLRVTLGDRLQREGYEVAAAADGNEGLLRAVREPFDLVVLDLMLPGRNGLELCRELRRRGLDVPVLMLTARGQLADRVAGLKLGADDYLTKPFEMAELLARVESCLRRRPHAIASAYRFGAVEVDFRRAEVTRDGSPVALAAKEFLLLRYFVEHRGELLTRNELLDGVWGVDSMPLTRTVDVHVAWLRKKVEPEPHHPRFIVTVHKLGYKFVG
jgi:two-component system, OmpR family, alkaline phosphatase synthesis response regulator PhoP